MNTPTAHPATDPHIFNEIATLASDAGWRWERYPSEVLWYRIAGKTGQDVTWDLIQSLPSEREDRRDRGLRWSTNDVQIDHLWMEIFPKHAYLRMKRTPLLPSKVGGASRSWSSLKLVRERAPMPFANPTLNERFVLLTIVPSIISLMFNRDLEERLLALNTDSLHVSLGYPNLRISLNTQQPCTATITRLTDFGVQFAERYLALHNSTSSLAW